MRCEGKRQREWALCHRSRVRALTPTPARRVAAIETEIFRHAESPLPYKSARQEDNLHLKSITARQRPTLYHAPRQISGVLLT